VAGFIRAMSRSQRGDHMRLVVSSAVLCALLVPTSGLAADGCLNKLLFGKVKLEKIAKPFEKDIIFGDQYDDGPFDSAKVLGYIVGRERDDSRRMFTADGRACAVIEINLTVNSVDDGGPNLTLQRTSGGYIVRSSAGAKMGEIKGKIY
jgi:hypothetical protein